MRPIRTRNTDGLGRRRSGSSDYHYSGAREDRVDESFLCGTRQTLQEVANEAGLKLNDLYVTFILKRIPVRAYDKELVRRICTQHLEQQLQEKKPALILCFGDVTVQSFFQNPEAEVKLLQGSWNDVRGFQTAVAYHPLARLGDVLTYDTSFWKTWRLLRSDCII